MGKNHQHMKRVKAEKSKTQLKTRVKNEKTKFLPKGLNDTKIDFKIKQIVIPQQFKEHAEGEILSRRKLNLKDILSRLRHYNVNVKSDCIEELKGVLESYPDEVLGLNLAQILQGTTPLILDREKKIRKGVIAVLDRIFEKVVAEHVSPFFSILSSYLRCSMTNIDRGIQEDSLYFFDVLLKHIPELVAADVEKIFPNLISLISKMRADSQQLTVNLGSKLTSVNWRIQVLRRLHTLLDTIITTEEKFKQSVNDDRTIFVNTCLSYPLIDDPYQSNVVKIDLTNSNMDVQESDVIIRNIQTLTSLLNDVWMEVHARTEGTSLKTEAGAVLTCVLHLYDLLIKHTIKQDGGIDINMQEHKTFLTNVMSLFPFTQYIDRKKETSNVMTLQSNAKCTVENLLIAHQFSLFNKQLGSKALITVANKLLQCVNDSLVNRNRISETEIKYLLPLAKTILLKNYATWNRQNVKVAEFLERFILFFDKIGTNFACRDEIFDVLCSILQTTHGIRSEGYQLWLKGLPKLLCQKAILSKVLDTLLLIAKQGNSVFLQSLLATMSQIFENFNDIEIQGCAHPQHEKLKIIFLFHYTPTLQISHKKVLYQFLNTSCDALYRPAIQCLLKK